jgi:hypothetical protein
MNDDQAKQLREAFPAKEVGKLPRVTCKQCRDAQGKVCSDHKKAKCAECGNWMTTAHMHLDYVGHAAVTDRLLRVDPEWSWEPMAQNEHGFPVMDASGGLWIKLTVAGVTRPGYGEPGNTGVKEAIGDALRNAAMRFGVALDLWSKADLSTTEPDAPTPEEAVDLVDANVLRNLRGAYLGLKSLVGDQEAQKYVTELLTPLGVTKFEELSKAQGEAALAAIEFHRVKMAEGVPA